MTDDSVGGDRNPCACAHAGDVSWRLNKSCAIHARFWTDSIGVVDVRHKLFGVVQQLTECACYCVCRPVLGRRRMVWIHMWSHAAIQHGVGGWFGWRALTCQLWCCTTRTLVGQYSD
jgi:hypothetical protein